MVYKWRPGYQHKVSAQTAGEVCRALEEEGRLNAASLVEESRPEDAPLHAEFEWDDSVAAEEYRKHQARNVIGSIIEVISPEVAPTRAFFNIVRREANYESVHVIIGDEDKRKALLDKALAELNSFRTKYSTLLELSKVFDAIDQISLEEVS